MKWEKHRYSSVPHIRPLFCNLSASRKRRGGLYAGSENLSREYAPSSGATPRCLHRTLYYGLFNSLLQKLIRQRSALAFLVVQKLDDQDRLTEVSHSVDGGIFQALRGFVLSMCYSIDITHGHACDCRQNCWSVDAGFVLVLPLHHGDLELDSVGVSTKDRGPICEKEIPVQEL